MLNVFNAHQQRAVPSAQLTTRALHAPSALLDISILPALLAILLITNQAQPACLALMSIPNAKHALLSRLVLSAQLAILFLLAMCAQLAIITLEEELFSAHSAPQR